MEPEQVASSIGWLGESIGFWVQTGAFSLSAIAAVLVIYFNGRLSRKRATIELILHQKGDKDLLADTRSVWALEKKNGTFSGLATNTESEECKCVLRVLNNHEFVALGIRKNAFDERIYKMSQCSNVMKVWSASNGFIRDIRSLEKKTTLFQELEWLATRWENSPIHQLSTKRPWQVWKP